jgi:hypothetical protein
VDELLELEPGIENCASLGKYGDSGLTERTNNKREVAMKIRTDRTDLTFVVMYEGFRCYSLRTGSSS